MYMFGVLFGTLLSVAYSQLPPCICPSTYDPLCGSDGFSYRNHCMMRCSIFVNPSIMLANDGLCEIESSSNKRFCMCTPSYAPKCGDDGTTYPNECLAECLRKENPIKFKMDGPCKGKSNMHCICGRIYDPVCGSNGVTYPNRCLLDCASSVDPSITMVKEGVCDGEKNPHCNCNSEIQPVCASDGEYYENRCVLDCFSSMDPRIMMVENKICDNVKNRTCNCTGEYKPVCGSNFVTYNNTCLLDCVHSLDPRVQWAKEGPCIEPLSYDDSDII